MLSCSTLKNISELIKTVADTEGQSEVARQMLCEKRSFEPYTAFKRISHFSSAITSQRLLEFLGENDVHISKQDAYYLIRLFDTNRDGKLSYPEFLNAVLPKANITLRKDVNARRPYDIQEDEALPSQIENALVRIFEEELEGHKKCESIRQELASSDDFNIMGAFREIDVRDEGFIDAQRIMKFMDRVLNPVEGPQVDAFMLRIDKDGDGVIRYTDFLEVFYSSQIEYKEENSPSSAKKLSITAESLKNLQYMNHLRETYNSPRKQYLSSNKVKYSADVLNSPHSTKASFAASVSIYKTPTKQIPVKPVYEDEVAEASKASTTRSSCYSVNFSPKRESPMKPTEEFELVKALKEIMEHIRTLESIKNDLSLRDDFNIHNAFAIFDTENQGFVNVRQLEQGFKLLGINFSASDIALLMKRLDGDSDGIVKFEDFSYVITPRASAFAKLKELKEPYYLLNLETALETFSEETLEAFRGFLRRLLDEEGLCESIRQRLAKRKTFNFHDAFKALDRYGKGFITTEQFKDLLKENGLSFSQKDFNILIERYSKSEKGKVSYNEFIREMTPKSVKKY